MWRTGIVLPRRRLSDACFRYGRRTAPSYKPSGSFAFASKRVGSIPARKGLLRAAARDIRVSGTCGSSEARGAFRAGVGRKLSVGGFLIIGMKCLIVSLVAALVLAGAWLVFSDEGSDDAEVICTLFNLSPEDVSDASVRIINKHTGKQQGRCDIPDQDPASCAEGFFRLPPQALSQVRGVRVQAPPVHGPDRGEEIGDWTQDELFRSSILKVRVSGDVLFSPQTGWVYFKVDL